MPLSRTLKTASPFSVCAEPQGDPATGIRVLGGILEQVGDDLLEPNRVSRRRAAPTSGNASAASVPTLLDAHAARLRRVPHATRHQIHRSRACSSMMTATDARHVEQFIDEPHQLLPSAARSSRTASPRTAPARPVPQQVDGMRDRRERVSQFMGQHGEELVLAAARASRRLSPSATPLRDVLDREQNQLFALTLAGILRALRQLQALARQRRCRECVFDDRSSASLRVKHRMQPLAH